MRAKLAAGALVIAGWLSAGQPVAVAGPFLDWLCGKQPNETAMTTYTPPYTGECAPAVAAAPVVVAPPPYVEYTGYRTVVQRVPVTTYRPVLTPAPYAGYAVTAYRPVVVWSNQARLVPYTTYRAAYAPATVATYGPPVTYSLPAGGVPVYAPTYPSAGPTYQALPLAPPAPPSIACPADGATLGVPPPAAPAESLPSQPVKTFDEKPIVPNPLMLPVPDRNGQATQAPETKTAAPPTPPANSETQPIPKVEPKLNSLPFTAPSDGEDRLTSRPHGPRFIQVAMPIAQPASERPARRSWQAGR